MFRRTHRVNPAWIGGVLFALLLASLAFAFVSHKGIPGRDYTYATLAFDDLSAGLREGSDVRIQGVRVGQVHEAFYEGGEARAELQLPGSMEVYKDATARIRSRSALGQLYVDIDPGTKSAGLLSSDEVLPKSHTKPMVELDTVLNALTPEARKGLATGLQTLGAGVGGRGKDLNELIGLSPELLADLGTTTQALSSEDADLVGLLVAAERLAGRFQRREEEITTLLAQSSEVMDAFNTQTGQALRKTLEGAPGALDQLKSSLSALSPVAAQASSAFEAITPAAGALGQAAPGLRKALSEGVAPFSAVPRVSSLAAPAFESLTGVARDARPLIPELGEALKYLRGPLELLVPYGPESVQLLDNLRDSFAGGDSQGNWLRTISIVVGADNVSGSSGQANPAVNRNAYPKPGEAATDKDRFNAGGQR